MLLSDSLLTFFRPLFHSAYKPVSAQLMPVQPFFSQQLLHYHLSGNTGMVNTGQPQYRLTLHPMPAGHNVLQSRGQGMPNVKLTGNIGWGHNDDKWLLIRVYPGFKVALLQPEPVPLLLHLPRLIGFGHFILSF
ncbi:hypothetical protein ES703_79163 [subsurface metagenome]